MYKNISIYIRIGKGNIINRLIRSIWSCKMLSKSNFASVRSVSLRRRFICFGLKKAAIEGCAFGTMSKLPFHSGIKFISRGNLLQA